MKTKKELKDELASAVARKKELTRSRLAYKASSRAQGLAKEMSRYYALVGMWSECGIAKEQARHIGLAYAFVRGRRYWKTERFTKDAPSAHGIAAYAGVKSDEIEAWLAVEPTAEELAAWDSHVALAKAKAHATNVARRALRDRAAE